MRDGHIGKKVVNLSLQYCQRSRCPFMMAFPHVAPNAEQKFIEMRFKSDIRIVVLEISL